MSEIGYCGLTRNFEALPPDARVIWNGAIAADQQRAYQHQAPAHVVSGVPTHTPPRPGGSTFSDALTRLHAGLTANHEPASVICARAGVERNRGAIYLWNLAQDGRIGGAMGENPLFGQAGQRPKCWLYWRRDA